MKSLKEIIKKNIYKNRNISFKIISIFRVLIMSYICVIYGATSRKCGRA